jgi:lysophospholipase L1-like esterase
MVIASLTSRRSRIELRPTVGVPRIVGVITGAITGALQGAFISVLIGDHVRQVGVRRKHRKQPFVPPAVECSSVRDSLPGIMTMNAMKTTPASGLRSASSTRDLNLSGVMLLAFVTLSSGSLACGMDAEDPNPLGSGNATTGGRSGAGSPGSGGADVGSGNGSGGAPNTGGASGQGTGGTPGGVIGGTGATTGVAGMPGAGSGGGSGVAGSSGGGAGGAAVPVGPTPDLATRMRCTGTDPIACHFGGAPGNYDVTVVIGGAAVGNTIVQAETHRTMLGPIQTSAGQTRRFTFTVNVRQPEGEPIQDVPAGTPGLDVIFTGSGGMLPQLQSIGYAAAPNPFMIYIAGDSTVCDQGSTAFGGWGQPLPQYFDYPVSIANYADSGESSGSFVGSANLFGAITSRLKANDWVFLQFGHNDKGAAGLQFHANMTRLVMGVKAKGAFPVLVTPVARAQFSGTTVQVQHIQGGVDLPAVVKQVGMEQNVPVLDLTARTVVWLTELGPNGWQPYHANGTDVTHTNPAGAAVEAGFLRDMIKQANLTPLIAHMR